MSLVRSLFPSFFRKKQSSYAGKKKLSLLGRKNGTLIRTIVTRISLSFKRRHHTLSRSVFKRKWRNTTQTSRKALKVRELFFWFARAGSESAISLSLSLSSSRRRRRRRRRARSQKRQRHTRAHTERERDRERKNATERRRHSLKRRQQGHVGGREI